MSKTVDKGPLRAICFEDFETFREKRYPGSICIRDADGFGEWVMWYCCPSGSGEISPLTVGAGFKPPSSPSWNWNSSKTEPTLSPSVNRVGRWHGWLRDGYWVTA